MVQRTGIFSFFDKDGMIDEYVLFYLSHMKEVLSKIIFVSNGQIAANEEKKIAHLVSKIIIRENKGFDAGAYREVILKERDQILRDADEVVLFNDTVFGPIYPIKDIFDEMGKKEIDFWGITRHEKAVAWENPVPACIQSYFICIRKNMLCSNDFMEFWNEQPETMKTLKEAVLKFEFTFTHFFEKRGFRWESYIDFHELDSADAEYNFSPTYYANYELVKYKKYPFIKRKNFIYQDGFKLCNGEDIRKCMDYVQENKLYDMGMVWKNILRIYDVHDIYAACHFAFVCPSGIEDSCVSKLPAVLAVNIRNDLTARYFLEKIQNVEEEFEEIIVCCTPAIAEQIKEQNIFLPDKIKIYFAQGESPLFGLENAKAELVCYVSDREYDFKSKHKSKSMTYSTIDNLIESIAEVRSIKSKFLNHRYLGVLFATDSYIGKECMNSGGVWTAQKYRSVKAAYEVLNLTVPFSESKRQISNNFSFWCRNNIMQKLVQNKNRLVRNLCPEDLDAGIIGVLPYLAQQNTYYSGILLSNRQAEIEYTNIREITTSMFDAYRSEEILIRFPLECICDVKHLCDFCENLEKIYIYGAGDYGHKVLNALERMKEKIAGFVVSDIQSNPDEVCGYPVIGRNKMIVDKDTGVIIAMSPEKQKPVKEALDKMNIRNVFRV